MPKMLTNQIERRIKAPNGAWIRVVMHGAHIKLNSEDLAAATAEPIDRLDRLLWVQHVEACKRFATDELLRRAFSVMALHNPVFAYALKLSELALSESLVLELVRDKFPCVRESFSCFHVGWMCINEWAERQAVVEWIAEGFEALVNNTGTACPRLDALNLSWCRVRYLKQFDGYKDAVAVGATA